MVHARELPIPDNLKGRAFREDRSFRKDLDAWAIALWREKDQRIDTILGQSSGDSSPA